MRAFDVLNKLGRLEAVTYHEHPYDKDATLMSAWDDRSQNQVFWIFRNRTIPRWVADDYEFGWSWIHDYSQINNVSDANWLVGVAYVECDGRITPPLQMSDCQLLERITPDEYQRIVAEAAAQS